MISEKTRARNATWRKNNAEKNRAYQRTYNCRTFFGMEPQDYDTLLKQQGGVCAICKNSEVTKQYGTIQRLAVDHCHSTGVIRGLLCSNCNHVLGKVKDNVVVLRAAALYLEVANTGFKVPSALSIEQSHKLVDEVLADLQGL